jgi:hypothetical protein
LESLDLQYHWKDFITTDKIDKEQAEISLSTKIIVREAKNDNFAVTI